MNLLYVEDDPLLAHSVAVKLKSRFAVDIVNTCNLALAMADKTEYDLIVLDYFLPDDTGLELCKKIRESNNSSLILFLSHHSGKREVIQALNSGADDYLAKPFDFDELIARLLSMVRRSISNNKSTDELYCGNFKVFQGSKEVYYQNLQIRLKRKEYLIFEYLMLHKGHIVSRTRLFEHVWNQHYYISNTIDVHMKRLRNKIEKPFGLNVIETAYGSGYRMLNPPRPCSNGRQKSRNKPG